MRKHHPYRVFVGSGEQQIPLIAGEHFVVRPRDFGSSLLPERLPARLDDFVRLAAAIHVADSIVPRQPNRDGGGWSRRMEVAIEVAEPEWWSQPAVAAAVTECLHALSADAWDIRFVADPAAKKSSPTKQRVFEFFRPDKVCLYSGGLDSLAGLAQRIHGQRAGTILPVTVRHQTQLSALARRQIDALSPLTADRQVIPHVIAQGMIKRIPLKALGLHRDETSHRCRSFMFAIFGAVVAALAGVDRVEMYESGIGAINLPLQAGITAKRTTRSSHPQFLQSMGRLASLVVERPMHFELPFIGATKGEMAAFLAAHRLDSLARQTASCVHFPLRRVGAKQCGTCPGCIFRRQALFAAKISEGPGSYQYDLFGTAADHARVPKKHRHPLTAFLHQVEGLQPLDVPGGMSGRLRDHLVRTGVVDGGDHDRLDEIAHLFRRYRREWLELLDEGHARGLPWANWVSRAVVGC